MKFTQFAIVLLLGTGFLSCQNSANVSIDTKADTVSYVLGAFQGKNMLQNFERAKVDSIINIDIYLKAFDVAYQEKSFKMDPDSNKKVIDQFFQTLQTSQRLAARDTTGNTPVFQPEQSLIDSVSYLLGADFGKGFLNSFTENGLDSILNITLIVEGYIASISKEELKLEVEANMPMLDEFFKKWQEDQMIAKHGDNKRAGEEFLAKNKALEGVTETASGLQYEVLVAGNGAKPKYSDRVKVHYTGTMVDGTVFDSSVERGEPATFGVGQVIPGWTEALQLMPVGSKWKLAIPYNIAYGAQGSRSIPPFSMLIFEVELLEIVK